MLETLYQQEIIEKSKEKKNTRMQVAQLLEKMYQKTCCRARGGDFHLPNFIHILNCTFKVLVYSSYHDILEF